MVIRLLREPHTRQKTCQRRKRQRGFTLIEVIIVVVMVGILASISAVFLVNAVDMWTAQSSWERNVTDGRRALDWLVRELRQIRDSDSLTVADDDNITFVNSSGVTIQFSVSGSDVLHDSDILVGGVSGLTFQYYDDSNNELTNVPLNNGQRKQVWSIQVTLLIPMEPGGGTVDQTMSSRVIPRSLQLEASS
jgi:prepilin-type N-terminal cleavage/methylation domain-containing protein